MSLTSVAFSALLLLSRRLSFSTSSNTPRVPAKQLGVTSVFLALCCALAVQTAWAAPANDNFANAQLVTGNPSNLAGSILGATLEPGEPLSSSPTVSIWYKWIASGSGYTSFATAGSEFDTILRVYTGSTVSNLVLVAASDNLENPDNSTVGARANTSRVNFLVTSGVQYSICISGYIDPGGTGVSKLSINRFDPPSINLSYGGSNGQVSLAWSAVSGATAYRVYRSTTSTDYSASAVYGPLVTNYLDSNLPFGTPFYYTVKAIVTGGKTYGSKQVSAILLAAPTNFTATWVSTQANLSWNSVAGAAQYDIYRTTDANPTLSSFSGAPLRSQAQNSYSDTGLTLGTKYSYIVKAVNTGYSAPSVSAASSIVSVTPLPAPGTPTGLAATPGNGLVSLTWNTVPTATGYDVWRSTDNTNFSAVASNLTTASYTNSGLVNGQTYYFQVRASNSGGASAFSASASAIPLPPLPAAPTGLTATAGNRQITLSWNAVSGATGYKIYRRISGAAYGATPLATVSGSTTSYSDGGLGNVQYFYVVVATNLRGDGGASNEASATALTAPILIGSEGDAQVVLNWSTIPGATGYRIYRRTNSTTYSATPLVTVAAPTTTYTDRPVVNGTTYYYVVKAYKDINPSSEAVSDASNEITATPQAPPAPPAPLNLVATGQANQISLSWNAAPGATSYKVFRALSWGSYNLASFTTTTSFTDTTTTNGTLYYYVVQAVNSGGSSPGSNEDYALSYAPGNLKAHFFPRVSWASRMVGGFFQGSNDFNTWTNLGVIKTVPLDTAYTDLALGANSYRYLRYLAPGGSYANIAELEFYNGATRINGTGFGSPGSYDNDPSVTFGAALDGSTATYFDEATTNPGYFVGIDTAPLPAPANLTAVAGDGQITLSWQPVARATKYKLYRRLSGGSFNYSQPLPSTAGTTSTTFVDIGRTNGVTYYYVVRANDGVSDSINSNEASATSGSLPAPNGLIAVSTGSGKITLYWNQVAGAASYYVYRSATVGGQDYSAPLTGGPVSAVVSYPGSKMMMWTDNAGLTDGNEYFYTVKAANSDDILSSPSNEASDIVDSLSIPWDTRDVGTILNAVATEAQSVSLDGNSVGSLAVAGPDGAVYESGTTTQLPPAPYDSSTNELTLEDGSVVAMPGEDVPNDESSFSSASFQASALQRRRTYQGTSGGPVVGIRSRKMRSDGKTYKGVSFDLQLLTRPFVAVEPAGAPYTETPHCYLGTAGLPSDTDAGVLFQKGVWRAFMNNGGGPVIKRLSTRQDYQPGELLSIQFYMDYRVVSKRRSFYRNIYLEVKSLDPNENNKMDTIAKSIRFGSVNGIRPKRFIQLAQNFPKNDPRGRKGATDLAVPTGSFMTELRWQRGQLHFTDGTSKLWTQSDTNADINNSSYGVFDNRNATTTWTTYGEDYDETNGIGINNPN